MIHLISRKYNEDTTDSMLFTPIVNDIIQKNGRKNICVWANSVDADVKLKSKYSLIKIFFYGIYRFKQNDIVFITSTPPFPVFIILLLALFKRIRVIFQVQDLYPDFLKLLTWEFRIIYYIMYPFAYLLYSRVDLFITISDEIKKQLNDNYRISYDKINVVQNWTDIEQSSYYEKKPGYRIVYIGNIGRAHDFNYFLKFLSSERQWLNIVIKTDKSSKINIVSYNKRDPINELKQQTVLQKIEWNHTRYSKDELKEFLNSFDYSFVFLGDGFDRILFPCKIYSSLAMIMPIIFFGSKDSYLNKWLTENNLGFHYSDIDQCYNNLDFYRKNIEIFNQSNPDSEKISRITKLITE